MAIEIKKMTFEEFKEEMPKAIKKLEQLGEDIDQAILEAKELKEKELAWKESVKKAFEEKKKISE